MKTGVELIAAERERQVSQEHWTAEHDDEHEYGELAIAGACYALPRDMRQKEIWNSTLVRMLWPFDDEWWKPREGRGTSGRIRELVKAGALIAAEIDRIQRQQK